MFGFSLVFKGINLLLQGGNKLGFKFLPTLQLGSQQTYNT